MTVKLSPHKVKKMMRYYFYGVSQPDIARKLAVDQSTVSLYSSRFKDMSAEVGLFAAGKEFKVFEEVAALRSLSVELMKTNLVLEDAKEGVKIIKTFRKLGVSPEKHVMLVKVCGKIDQPGFVDGALKLARIEDESGISYEEATSKFEKVTGELPVAKRNLKTTKTELESLNTLVSNRKQELAATESQVAQYRREVESWRAKIEHDNKSLLARIQTEAGTKKAELDREVEYKMKQLKVKQEEIEEVARLKADLRETGLDIQTLAEMAKEFSYGSKKS